MWRPVDPVEPSVSDARAVELLVELVQSNGGSVAASRVGGLYPLHAGLKQRIGKVNRAEFMIQAGGEVRKHMYG